MIIDQPLETTQNWIFHAERELQSILFSSHSQFLVLSLIETREITNHTIHKFNGRSHAFQTSCHID